MDSENKAWTIIGVTFFLAGALLVAYCVGGAYRRDVALAHAGICQLQNVGNDGWHTERCK